MVVKNKRAVRLYLDEASYRWLESESKRGDRSVSQVVRDILADWIKVLSGPDGSTQPPQTAPKPQKMRKGFVRKPMDFTIDLGLEESILNSPVVVGRQMIEEFKLNEDNEGLPRITFESGNVAIPWSKLIPILEFCLNERDMTALFYPIETRFEMIGGAPGSSLKWWLQRAETKRIRASSPESLPPAVKRFPVAP